MSVAGLASCLNERGKERPGGAVVGVAAAVSFGSDVEGDRHAGGDFCLLRGDVAARDELFQNGIGRGRHELAGNFGARDLGEDMRAAADDAIGGARQACRAVADDFRRELHEGRGRNAGDAT